MTASSFEAIYDEIVQTHGCTTMIDKSIAHRLAELIANGTGSAADIVSLRQMLPERGVAAAAARPPSRHDLRLLSDRELDGLHYLLTRCCLDVTKETAPLRPDRRLRGGRSETTREFALRQLGAEWDRLEREGRRPSAAEALRYRDILMAQLPKHHGVPLLTMPELGFPRFEYGAYRPTEAAAPKVTESATAERHAGDAAATAEPPRASNVVGVPSWQRRGNAPPIVTERAPP
jgi:hypothetical protein